MRSGCTLENVHLQYTDMGIGNDRIVAKSFTHIAMLHLQDSKAEKNSVHPELNQTMFTQFQKSPQLNDIIFAENLKKMVILPISKILTFLKIK